MEEMLTAYRARARLRKSIASVGPVALIAVVLFAMAGCSAQNPEPFIASPPPSSPVQSYSSGTRVAPHMVVASWYGPGFQGRPTSTGERYNEYGMTAASKTLPLGTHLRVTNPANGRTVEVRINDRGPYVRGRSIDLSKGAAERLGIKNQGVAPVEISSVDYPATPLAYTAPHDYPAYTMPHHSYSAYHRVAWHPAAASRTAVHRDWFAHHRTSHRTRYHHTSRPKMVWNPVGAWLASSLPRF